MQDVMLETQEGELKSFKQPRHGRIRMKLHSIRELVILSPQSKERRNGGVISEKDGMSGGWFWSLPREKHEEVHEGDEEVQQNSVNPFGKVEPLRESSPTIVDTWEC